MNQDNAGVSPVNKVADDGAANQSAQAKTAILGKACDEVHAAHAVHVGLDRGERRGGYLSVSNCNSRSSHTLRSGHVLVEAGAVPVRAVFAGVYQGHP